MCTGVQCQVHNTLYTYVHYYTYVHVHVVCYMYSTYTVHCTCKGYCVQCIYLPLKDNSCPLRDIQH